MSGDRLYCDPDLAQFYDLDNAPGADDAMIARLARGRARILDLGCGTGRLALSLADGRQITGVDPAGAMLDIARRKPGAERVRWVKADARTVRLGAGFDLICMTGHAFQVFLTEADRAAVLATIAAHLAPGGTFLFDSRNPACREWEEWVPERSREVRDLPDLGRVTSWNDVSWDDATGIAIYETHYRIDASGRTHTARSAIAFPERDEIARLIGGADLAADRWLGDWLGGPCTPTSPEIIPIGRST